MRLRMPNEETISNAPMTTNQIPTTIARVMIDSNGDAITTMPAIRLITPTKIDHPRPGRCGIADGGNGGGDTAEDEPDADPDGQQQHRVSLAEMTKRQHGQDQ